MSARLARLVGLTAGWLAMRLLLRALDVVEAADAGQLVDEPAAA